MKIEPLIWTPEARREQRRLSFTKAQFFCLGVSGAALAGCVDAWWKSGHVAALFFVLALILGACKVASCRRPRRTYVAQPIALPEA
ncbi:MAG TPA: hypothetical protein PK416_03090 [Thermodesulfobacteriota bacterium]|nr:hypothetical protein [Thermodesulfobacteriota bacterium]